MKLIFEFALKIIIKLFFKKILNRYGDNSFNLVMQTSTSSKSITKKVSIKGGNNEYDEWENHLIIRFPKEVAGKIDEFLDEETPAVFIFL